jgi:hypothetical protein
VSRQSAFMNNAATDFEGWSRWMSKLFKPGVIGWSVTQRALGSNMSVDIQVGDGVPMTANTAPWSWITAVENVTIAAASANPRNDLIVAWVDLSVTNPSTATPNNPGALKFMVVQGTPAASPSDPSNSTVQTAVGASNPFIILSRVALLSTTTQITNGIITNFSRPIALNVQRLWGGSSNTLGHLVPDAADSTVALLGSAQTWTGVQIFGAQKLVADTPTIRNWDGWQDANESWTFATATTITVPSDATLKYSVGDKIKLTQSAVVKYFYIVGVSTTVLTITGGSDYTLANSAITANYYSKAASPLGFPTWFNYSPTPTGFSVLPTNLVSQFKIDGRSCTLVHSEGAVGTSNSGGFTIPLPVTAATVANMVWRVACAIADNGVSIMGQGLIASGGTTLGLSKDAANNAFTASGGKTVYGVQITYGI